MVKVATSIITYDTDWQAYLQRKSCCRGLLRSPEKYNMRYFSKNR